MPHCPVATRSAETATVAPIGGSTGPVSVAAPVKGMVGRYLLATAGIMLVGIGWIGAFLPGVPTVGPLLLASYCFARSCPWLENRLIRNRFFAPFLQYMDGDCELPLRARFSAIGIMWTSIAASSVFLAYFREGPVWLIAIVIASGFIGTICIWRFRRQPHPQFERKTVGDK
jgi:uncharacterized membrane protein YbaN (DUF454 family)